MTLAIETNNLTRRFGNRIAVDRIALRVPERAIYGFLGRNGAGKTTTIRMILSLIRPTAGEVRVFGQDVLADRLKTAQRIGAMVEAPALYDRLTGRENLEVARLLRKAPKNEIDRVLELADLRTAADRLAGGYSQGMRQRLAIARALIGAPDLLILDEPANGLDPDGILELRTFLRGLPEAQGVTVMISSHLLSEIESMADHVGLMHDGRLLVQSPLSDLKSAEQADVEFGVLNPKRALGVFRDLGIKARHDLDGAVYVDLKPEQQRPDPLAALTRKLVNEGVEVFQVATRQPSLESIYLNLVGRRSATSEARVAESADA